MTEDLMGIYSLHHPLTGDEVLYVGRSIHMDTRFWQHCYMLSKGIHHTCEFQEWFNNNLLSASDLSYRVVELVSDSENLFDAELRAFKEKSPRFWTIEPMKAPLDWAKLSSESLDKIFEERKLRTLKRHYEEIETYGENFRNLYESGNTIKESAEKLGISFSVGLRLVKALDIKIRSQALHLAPSWRKDLSEEKTMMLVSEAYSNNGPRWEDVAKALGSSTTDARNWGIKLGLHTSKGQRLGVDYAIAIHGEDWIKKHILDNYVNGSKTLAEIGLDLGVSGKTVKVLLGKFVEGGSEINGCSLSTKKAQNVRREAILEKYPKDWLLDFIRAEYLDGDLFFDEVLERLDISRSDFKKLLKTLPLGEIPDGRTLAAQKRLRRNST